MLDAGTHHLGTDNATLSVRTERVGAAAKAGHDLLLHVTAWEATITVGDTISMRLDADPSSLRVREGHGGMMELDDSDLDNIHQTIDDEVLQRRDISFASTSAEVESDVVRVQGELTLFGNTRPVAFDLRFGDDGDVSGSAVVKQSDWGIRPYSALFGALKVADDVRVELDGHPT